ncbi:hypothetical protein TWF718_005783 [Orbilia javanica]|uniref:Uncharacterized protein n=1 Tax=Orbilia javanica TaxID=47235 RepID=A0AAN8RJP5_9PEZI
MSLILRVSGVKYRGTQGAGKKPGPHQEPPADPDSFPEHSEGDRFSRIPQWFAVSEVPPQYADPSGYMLMVTIGDSVTTYANALGVQPWVTDVLKKVLHWRYINHDRTLDINFSRHDDRERLAEEINITFRNYATNLHYLLRNGAVPPEKFDSKMKQYQAMVELSTKIYKIGSYRVSGYLLYKIGERLMEEIIQERLAIDAGLIDAASVVPGHPAQDVPMIVFPRLKLTFKDTSINITHQLRTHNASFPANSTSRCPVYSASKNCKYAPGAVSIKPAVLITVKIKRCRTARTLRRPPTTPPRPLPKVNCPGSMQPAKSHNRQMWPPHQQLPLLKRVPLGDWDSTKNSTRSPDSWDPQARTTLVVVTLWALVGVGIGLVFWALWRRENARAMARQREENNRAVRGDGGDDDDDIPLETV